MSEPIPKLSEELNTIVQVLRNGDHEHALLLMEKILQANNDNSNHTTGIEKLYPLYLKLCVINGKEDVPIEWIKKTLSVDFSSGIQFINKRVENITTILNEMVTSGEFNRDCYQKVLKLREKLAYILHIEPGNSEAHAEIEKLRSIVVKDPDSNMKFKQQEINDHAQILISLPSYIEIESTTSCNINPPCVMCHPRYLRSTDENIDEEVLQKIKAYTPYAEKISLHGGGEPLMIPNLLTTIDNIDPQKTSVVFSTNGLLLTEKKCEEIVKKGIAYLNISIDAATAATYLKLRRNDFKKITNNIKHLSRIKKENNYTRPQICLSMVLMRENIEETEKFVQLAYELGAEYVEFIRLGELEKSKQYKIINGDFTFDYGEQRIENYPELHDYWMHLAVKKAEELRLIFRYGGLQGYDNDIYLSSKNKPEDVSNFHEGNNNASSMLCMKPWESILTLIKGTVIFCCHTDNNVLGNLKNQSLEEIWNSKMAQDIRTMMVNDPLPNICKNCTAYKVRKKTWSMYKN